MSTCEVCGQPLKNGNRFCSHSCSNRGVHRKKPTPTRKCEGCSVEFFVYAKSKKRFHSLKCYKTWLKSHVLTRTCKICGVEFQGNRNFCSPKCNSINANRAPRNGVVRVFKPLHPCAVCGTETKNLKFCSRSCTGRGQAKTIEEHVTSRREWSRKARERAKQRPKVKNHRKLTDDEKQALYANQQGQCALCREREARTIDHCHVTGEIRGMLCYSCNTSIGALGDTVEGVQRAINYLQAFEERMAL